MLKLRLIYGQPEGVMVSASKPLSAGVMVCRKFTRLGLFPAPKAGLSDITRLYVAKFGVPPAGQKVFIRTEQMNDYLGSLIYTTRGIVPVEEAWDSEAEAT